MISTPAFYASRTAFFQFLEFSELDWNWRRRPCAFCWHESQRLDLAQPIQFLDVVVRHLLAPLGLVLLGAGLQVHARLLSQIAELGDVSDVSRTWLW